MWFKLEIVHGMGCVCDLKIVHGMGCVCDLMVKAFCRVFSRGQEEDWLEQLVFDVISGITSQTFVLCMLTSVLLSICHSACCPQF